MNLRLGRSGNSDIPKKLTARFESRARGAAASRRRCARSLPGTSLGAWLEGHKIDTQNRLDWIDVDRKNRLDRLERLDR